MERPLRDDSCDWTTRERAEHQGVAVNDPKNLLITREHVRRLLPLMRLSPEQEAGVLELPYPVRFGVAAAAFEEVGVDLDVLMDRMGGSP